MAELDAKVCVVTGGSRGIGAAICRLFAAEGATLVVIDRDDALAPPLAGELERAGVHHLYIPADVRSEAAIADAARRVEDEFGAAHVLVNNAGISRLGPSMSFPLADWEESFAVLTTGVFLCSREFGRLMRASGGGTIVNISSLNGIVNFPMRLAYSAAKAAVLSMTRVLAVEWSAYAIRVNAVAPGMIETAMLRQVIEEGLIDEGAYMAHTPLRRFGRPEEIAEAVLFLAGPRSSYMTGQVIVPDGGWTAFNWIPWSGDPDAPEIAQAGAGHGR